MGRSWMLQGAKSPRYYSRQDRQNSLTGQLWACFWKGVIQVENVQFEVVEGNRLVIHVDLNHRGDISASGKTRRVASTLGNVSVKDANGVEVKIGLNIYVKPDV